MALLSLKDIRLDYKIAGTPTQVLKKVDFELQEGEMVAILGPSGSGKSTLLYILGCLLKPTAGHFEFAGVDIAKLSSEKLAELRSREIGFVFQQFHLLPRASVLDNVLLSARYNQSDKRSEGELRSRAEQLIASVGLTSHLSHKPNQLSGGQQQRVAIARALMNNPKLILADEPTGNLDSKSTAQVLELLQEIHKSGRTVIIITHDQSVADRCQRVVRIHDGVMIGGTPEIVARPVVEDASENTLAMNVLSAVNKSNVEKVQRYARTAWNNLLRNKARSILTMLGVTIGIAAVLSTITLGGYTRAKILATYENLGVNKLVVRAYPRWNLQARDVTGAKFDGVSERSDIGPMRKLFPEISRISAVEQDWEVRSATFGGRIDDQVSLLGVSPDYFTITNRHLSVGRAFTQWHQDNHSRVCVVGPEIVTKLFGRSSAMGQIIGIGGSGDKQYNCQIIGVLTPQASNSEWIKPNQQILMPGSYISLMANQWYAKPHEFDMQIKSGASIEDLQTKIKQFFFLKYGRSAQISVDSDEVLVAQMRRFLNLFAILLSAVAFISLAVGGIGITNMMLVSVAERFKEIGLRKALGARDSEIRAQFLVESVILCSLAGATGIICGIIGYHAVLYLASKLFNKIQFEWVFNPSAMVLSAACILAVGIASGIVPAFRAEKLEVVEALRSE